MRIWNKRPPWRIRLKLWWSRLFIRSDEFHKSLSTDIHIMRYMCDCEKGRYCDDIGARRLEAHRRTENVYDGAGIDG